MPTATVRAVGIYMTAMLMAVGMPTIAVGVVLRLPTAEDMLTAAIGIA